MIQKILGQLPGREREPSVSPPSPLTPDAISLWKAIAPKRKPDPRETALFNFHLTHQGVAPETEDQGAFVDYLRRYNTPFVEQGNPFLASLSVYPEDFADISFKLKIWSPEPPHLGHPILTFLELPARAEYKPFKIPYNLLVLGEGESIYTSGQDYEVIGYDQSQKKLLWDEISPSEDWTVNPIVSGDMELKRKFVDGALSILTKVAQRVDPTQAAEMDSHMREALERVRKGHDIKWRLNLPWWKTLFAPEFHQPGSVFADSSTLFLERRRIQDHTLAQDYLNRDHGFFLPKAVSISS